MYPSDNEVKGQMGEDLVRYTLTSHGYSVKYHYTTDPGCDGVFSGNGITLGGFEVNNWKPNTFFDNDRIDGIDGNLLCGFEWIDEEYVKHGEKMQYRFHFAFGATRTEMQIARAKELGIIYIHTQTLPTSDELWSLIESSLGWNSYNKFYKVTCIGNDNLQNDRTSMMVLVTPIISNIINPIQVITSTISSKSKALDWRFRLKESLLELKSSVKAKLSKSHFVSKNTALC